MQSDFPRDSRGLYSYLEGTVLAFALFNIHATQFQPLSLWARLVPTSLLLAGLAGCILDSRVLRASGWAGIVVVLLVASVISIPGEDYVLGLYTHGPPEVTTLEICVRLIAGFMITAILVLTYRAASRASKHSG